MRQLKSSGTDYELLRHHLFPGDGNESIAFCLCGVAFQDNNETLFIHQVFVVPHEVCKTRKPDLIEWPGEFLDDVLTAALNRNLQILKIHSHPGGYPEFSWTDDECDHKVFRSINGWLDNDKPNASAIMLPDGRIFGRFIDSKCEFHSIDKVSIVGDRITIWNYSGTTSFNSEQDLRTIQAFGQGTVNALHRLTVGVVGCSGTGSIITEQLARSGVGSIVLIDPDVVELKNLNRILNSTISDVKAANPKTKVLEKAISRFGFGTQVSTSEANICDDRTTLKTLSQCDVVFGCTDNAESRHCLNQLATYYLVPYIDMGVKLIADGVGGIRKIAGAIHYLQPKGSSLLSRGVYTPAILGAENTRRKDPDRYKKLFEEKYIKDAGPIGSPAVLSVNMQIAATAFNEFLNRIHHYKSAALWNSAIIRLSISDDFLETDTDGPPDKFLAKFAGLGDQEPFIGVIGL